jgi:hypothetical protein
VRWTINSIVAGNKELLEVDDDQELGSQLDVIIVLMPGKAYRMRKLQWAYK